MVQVIPLKNVASLLSLTLAKNRHYKSFNFCQFKSYNIHLLFQLAFFFLRQKD